MATSGSDSIFSVGVTQIAIPVGVTLAVFCNFNTAAGVNALQYRNLTGGTLLNLGTPPLGTTFTAAQLVAIGASGSYVETTAEYSIDGPCVFYLAAPGATQVVCFKLGRTQGA